MTKPAYDIPTRLTWSTSVRALLLLPLALLLVVFLYVRERLGG